MRHLYRSREAELAEIEWQLRVGSCRPDFGRFGGDRLGRRVER